MSADDSVDDDDDSDSDDVSLKRHTVESVRLAAWRSG